MQSQQLQQLDDLEDRVREELWLQGELEFLLWPQQVPIWKAIFSIPPGVNEFVNDISRQFGKSVIGCNFSLARAIRMRNKGWLIVGPDIDQTREIVNDKMRLLLETAPDGLIKPIPSENKWRIYHDRDWSAQDYSEIGITGFKEGASSRRGKTIQDIVFEEIVDVHEDVFSYKVRSVFGPMMTHSDGGIMLFNTTRPKQPHHPYLTEVMPRAKLRKAYIKRTIDDNIALSAEQKAAAIERSGGPDSDDTKRELYCITVVDKKLACVPDFKPDRDIGEFDLPQYWFPFVSIDWGGVRDKTCALLYTYDYMLNLLLFIDERVFDPNTATSKIIPEVMEMEKQWLPLSGHDQIRSRWVDAPPNFVTTDLWADYKYRANMPLKLDWEATLNGLNNAFHRNQARIHPRCRFLSVSCESGILNKNRTDFERTIALGHMDGVAAAMYANRMLDKSNPFPQHAIIPVSQQILQPSQSHAIIGQNPAPHMQQKRSLSQIAQPFRETKGFGKHRR